MTSAIRLEKRCLLPEKTTKESKRSFRAMPIDGDLLCSSSSSDEDDEERGLEIKSNGGGKIPFEILQRLRKANRRRHHCCRRLVRYIFCLMILPLIFITFYLSLYSRMQNRQLALSDWGLNTTRNIADYIFPDNDTSLLEPRYTCKSPEKFFLLIAVWSDLHNFAQRQTIRETWGNTSEFNYGMFLKLHQHMKGKYLEPSGMRLEFYNEYLGLNENKTINDETVIPTRVIFIVGRKKPISLIENEVINMRIRSESERYQDVVQEDFIDTYNNLTIKSVMALKWVKRHCLEKCAYFMKCDDDTFVNVPNLLQYLLGGTIPIYNDTLDFYNRRTYKVLSERNRLNKIRNYLTGYIFCAVSPESDFNSKWYMPYYMYPNEKYPRYISGAGYLMSIDVVAKLYEAALNTTFIYLEDVYITGMCADKAKIQRIHEPLLSYHHFNHLCSLKGSISQHYMKGNKLLEAYTFIKNLTYECASPGSIFQYSPVRRKGDCG